MALEQKEIKKAYIRKEGDDYSAMQGPCPEGFHVPTINERLALTQAGYACGAWIAPSASGSTTNLINRLKLPMAGQRLPHSNGNVTDQGTRGYYSANTTAYDTSIKPFYILSDAYYAGNVNMYKTTGNCIRAFKDTPVIPDDTRTVIYQGSGNSGVYWNSLLGLISVSGNGSTRYTIADKNLGATTVWNSGDTLSEANCGKYYQRGNNYGFPFTGTLSNTSTTQVNASNYGPGNYYSSNIYIAIQSSWDTPVNNNLRGGETGVVRRLKEHIIFSSARLPDAYQEVEYIESTGTQYINTGYTPNVNTEIETELSWGTQSTEWAVFFGLTGNDRSTDGILGRIYSTTSTNFNPRFCNANYDERQITNTSLDTFHNIILKSGSCSLDGTSYTITTNSTPYQSTIDIFAGNNGGSHGWRAGKCKIKTFKISTSGTLYRDLVPCYRKSDNVIGMYDLVNNQFYTNSGSGTFTKGSDV